jgi:hypothetical protein
MSRVVLVTVTYYPNISDIRFQLALELCQLAASKEIQTVIVDDSPDHPAVRDALEKGGKGYVKVYQQDKAIYQGKGGALRQAIYNAREMLVEANENKSSDNNCENTAICFAEPEKVDIVNHIHHIVRSILDGSTDIVVPKRNDKLFRETYPIEQFHSENFANLHFNSLAKRFEGFQTENATQIDWLFGPFAFRSSLADNWLNYEGKSWDAQMIPYVRAVRNENRRISSVTIDFRHPKEMKQQEEGDPKWTNKRLQQLNILFDLLGVKELS